MKIIKCPFTKKEAAEKILNLILEYQEMPSWEIGITYEGEIDSISDDSSRGFGLPCIASRYFYTTVDTTISKKNKEGVVEQIMNEWTPNTDDFYEIQFKSGDY